MGKGIKQSENQMNPARQGECTYSEGLFVTEIPVWYQKNGKVNPVWLSMCEEERNQTTGLLERVTSLSNLQKAYKQVKKNGGSGGVDKMSIKEFGEWFNKHYQELQEEIQNGIYQPQAVLGIKIPKARGGFRQLGIPKLLSYYFITVSCRNVFARTNIRIDSIF